jgi:hypothetical protein
MLAPILLELGIYALKTYIKSTDDTKDDKILEVVQAGAQYLAPKANNTISEKISDELKCSVMAETQRAK